MLTNDRAEFWSFYADEFLRLDWMAEPADRRVVECNHAIGKFITNRDQFDAMRPYSFFPPALAGGIEGLSRIGGQTSGGRTFLPDEAGCAALGWPATIGLSLDKLGWGTGTLEARPEIKGAGTPFERTRLHPNRVRTVLADSPALLASFESACRAGADAPPLMTSRLDFMKRMVGGQSERNGVHGVATSRAQLGRSRIKFVPVWAAIRQSDRLHEHLDLVSAALPHGVTRCEAPWICEIRFTPGTIRAVYFDTVRDDDHLIALASRVSRNYDDLQFTLQDMIADARRHLELVAHTTQPGEGGGFTWIKVCDINEKFKSPTEIAHFRDSRKAWFFAKDEVIVGGVGKFFTDMESFFGRDVGFTSPDRAALHLHHELYGLAVLRDHLRVCSRFLLACELQRGKTLAGRLRSTIPAEVRRRLLQSLNASDVLDATDEGDAITLALQYPRLGDSRAAFRFGVEELAEVVP
jgi:hypothetical protein